MRKTSNLESFELMLGQSEKMDQLDIFGKSLSDTKVNEEIYSLDSKEAYVEGAQLVS